jgi:hypothetical protein
MATFFSRGRPGRRSRPDPHHQRALHQRRRLGRAARYTTAALLVLTVLFCAPVAAWAADGTPTPATPSTPSATPRGAGAATPDVQPGPSPAPPSGSSPTSTTGTSTPGTTAPSTPTTSTPSAPTPTTTPTAPTIPGDGGSGGIADWITNVITKAITSFFKDLVIGGLNPLLDLLGRTLLTTPEPSELPAIGQLWSTSWTITVAAYGLLIMAGGILALSYQTTQTSTSIKEILPRIPIGFLAAGFSQLLAAKAIELANPLPAAILRGGVDPNTASAQLRNIVIGALNGGVDSANRDIFTIFLGVFLALAVAALMCVYIGRLTLTVCLIGMGPVFLAGHALPQTERFAFWWWKAFGADLAIQVVQSFVLLASFKVFFTPGGFTLLGPTPDGLVNLLAAITMVYFLIKLPFWMMPRIGQGRPGILARIVRAYVMGRAMGFLRGGVLPRRPRVRTVRVPRGGRGPGGRGGGRGGRPRRPGGPGGGGDPYDRIEVDRNGQGLIPLTRVPRVRRPGPARGVPRQPSPPTPPRQRSRHRQLTIPYSSAVGPGNTGRYLPRDGGTWIDRDGQTMLPFDVAAPPATSPRGAAGRPAPPAPAGRRRTPTPRTPAPRPPTPPRRAAPRPRQLPLPGMTRLPRNPRPGRTDQP